MATQTQVGPWSDPGPAAQRAHGTHYSEQQLGQREILCKAFQPSLTIGRTEQLKNEAADS